MKNKFRRTYISGSKKKELEVMIKVQGKERNYVDCDWIEYRRLLLTILIDTIIVSSSWKNLFGKIRYLLLIFALLLFKFIVVFFGLLALSIVFQIAYMIFSAKEKRRIIEFNICQSVLNNEIKKISGIELTKLNLL